MLYLKNTEASGSAPVICRLTKLTSTKIAKVVHSESYEQNLNKEE